MKWSFMTAKKTDGVEDLNNLKKNHNNNKKMNVAPARECLKDKSLDMHSHHTAIY